MNTLKKIIKKLRTHQILRPIIWAAIMIGSSLVFRGNENSWLILNFLISGAVVDILFISRSARVNSKCNKQEVL